MKILNQLKENKGFTLIELMVSICIMAIAFAGLATMQIACINGNSIASNLTTGITLAQDKIEELNSIDYDDSELDDNNPSNNTILRDSIGESVDDDHREAGIDAQGNPGGTYTRIWNIADDTPINGRKTVVVIVTWQNHQVTLSSVLGN